MSSTRNDKVHSQMMRDFIEILHSPLIIKDFKGNFENK